MFTAMEDVKRHVGTCWNLPNSQSFKDQKSEGQKSCKLAVVLRVDSVVMVSGCLRNMLKYVEIMVYESFYDSL